MFYLTNIYIYAEGIKLNYLVPPIHYYQLFFLLHNLASTMLEEK